MAIVEKAEVNVGDVVQFVHHVEGGIGYALVVIKADEVCTQHGWQTLATLLDKDLKFLEGIPARTLKLIKGVHDGE